MLLYILFNVVSLWSAFSLALVNKAFEYLNIFRKSETTKEVLKLSLIAATKDLLMLSTISGLIILP